MAQPTSTSTTKKISSRSFYSEWHGHKVPHLEALLPQLRAHSDALIFTAGDSSLDNKYWFSDTRPAVGVYKDGLDPPISVAAVTYWMNYLLEQQEHQPKYAVINTAVEATTLNERSYRLRPQDRFIRDNIRSDDVLVVSIGGNDVALAPAPCTIASICGILALPTQCIESGVSFCACPMNDCCCGCGPSLLSCLGTCHRALATFDIYLVLGYSIISSS